MTRWRLATTTAVAGLLCAANSPAWSNGDGFFQSKEIPGNPEYVIFGNVKDVQGRYLDNAAVKVFVAEHMLYFTAKTDVLGRFRTEDIGRAIKELGYEVDPSLVKVTVEYAGYHVVRREYRGRFGQNKGAVELNFRLERDGGAN